MRRYVLGWYTVDDVYLITNVRVVLQRETASNMIWGNTNITLYIDVDLGAIQISRYIEVKYI